MSQELLIKRRRNNVTLTEMANQTNITRDILSQIERGNKQVVQNRVFDSLKNWLLKEG